MIQRRALITGLISLLAAPAIVRISSLMPVKPMVPEWTPIVWTFPTRDIFYSADALAEVVRNAEVKPILGFIIQ